MAVRTRTAAVAAFENVSNAQVAINELRRAGFTEDSIGFVAHDRDERTTERGATTGESKAGQGAATGAAVGGGGAALWSLAVAAGALPAIGPIIAGGVLAAVLASAAGGAAVGGLVGGLVGTGMTEEEARGYEKEFERGRTIISVNAPQRYDEALGILTRNGGFTTTD